jgi:Zn/Cd-binding protein ZinT
LAGILGILLVFSFVMIGCDNGGDNDPEPDLAEWAGTWNAIDQYLDDEAFDEAWTDAVTAIKTAEPNAVVDAATLKGMFTAMLKTDFKSCVIEGNTMKIYTGPNAAGSPTATITYAYAGIHTVESEEGSQEWYKFTGDKAGQFKYLILGPTHQDAPGSMMHFHLQYSATSFESATADPNWVATVTPNTTALTKIVEEVAAFPWAAYAYMFVPTLEE